MARSHRKDIVSIPYYATPAQMMQGLQARGIALKWRDTPVDSHIEADMRRALDAYVTETPDHIAIKGWILSHFTGVSTVATAAADARHVEDIMGEVMYGGMPIDEAARRLALAASKPRS